MRQIWKGRCGDHIMFQHSVLTSDLFMLSQMQFVLNNRSVNFTDISFQLMDSLNGTAVTVEITLSSENQTEVVTELLQYYSSSFSMLGGYAISVDNRGVQAVTASCESQ